MPCAVSVWISFVVSRYFSSANARQMRIRAHFARACRPPLRWRPDVREHVWPFVAGDGAVLARVVAASGVAAYMRPYHLAVQKGPAGTGAAAAVPWQYS